MSEPVSRFVMEGDAEYGVFLERPHLRWHGEDNSPAPGWHSARPGDLLVACLAAQFAHEVARLQAIVDQDIGGALDRAEKAVLNRDAGYEAGAADGRERVAALESAMNEALLMIERAALEVESDAKVGERHDAAAELWSLHRALMADGPWPLLARRHAAAVEVAEAVTEVEVARIAYRNGGGFVNYTAWNKALARQEEALHRYRTTKGAADVRP